MSLSEEGRTVLKLVLARGKSYSEIAALLGIDAPAARARAHAALGELTGPDETAPDPELADFLLGRADRLAVATTRQRIEADPELADRVEGLEEQLRLIAPISSRAAQAQPAPEAPVTPVGDEPLENPPPPPASPQPEPPPAPAPHAPVPAPVRAEGPPPVRPEGSGSGVPPRPAEAADQLDADAGPVRREGLSAAQRRLVAVLLGAALLAAILILLLTGVITGSGEEEPTDGNAAPTTAVLNAVAGESGEGTAQIGFNSQGNLAANLQVSGLEPSRKGQSYALWLYGSKGAFPVNQSRVDRSGSIAGQIPLNEAVICLIAADVFPEIRLSRVSDPQLRQALGQARRANGGSGKIPDYVGETVLSGRISMPQEAKDRIVPGCTGAAATGTAPG